MGGQKALLPVAGELAIVRAVRLLSTLFPHGVVVTVDEEVKRASPWPTVPDMYPGAGPLAGIHAALSHQRGPCFILACDMPNIHLPLIRLQVDTWQSLDEPCALVPRAHGYWEALHGIYSPALLPAIEEVLRSEGRVPPMQRLLDQWGATPLAEDRVRQLCPDLSCFANWNSPGDVDNSGGI